MDLAARPRAAVVLLLKQPTLLGLSADVACDRTNGLENLIPAEVEDKMMFVRGRASEMLIGCPFSPRHV